MNPGLFSFHTLTLGPFGHSRTTVCARRLIGSCLFVAMLVVLPCMNLAWCAEPLFSGLHSVCVHYICVCGSQPEAFSCWIISRANRWTDWPIGVQSGYLWGRWQRRLRIPDEPSTYCCPDMVRMNDHTSVTVSLKLPPVPKVSQGSQRFFYRMCSIEMCSLYFSFFYLFLDFKISLI